jgi:hypothetical protein
MAIALHFDAELSDDERRARLYRGEIFVYGPRPATRELCDFARELVREAFLTTRLRFGARAPGRAVRRCPAS